ncbi:MAG: signal peptidase I [Clostridia bacterium]
MPSKKGTKMKVLNKILEIILNIIIVLISIVVIIALVYVVQTKVQNKPSANIFGYTAFEVATGSMSGTIEIGDMVIVEITDNIQENDIIVYIQDDNFITHRVIEIKEDTIITKGDANTSRDLPIEKSQIFGKVVKVIPDVGIWKKVLTTPSVLIAIIITIILFGLAISYDTTDKNATKEKETCNKQNVRKDI